MAKESMITRTIVTTDAEILCLDVESGEACNRSITLPRTYKKEKEILKLAELEIMATEPNVHPVHVVHTNIKETLYGMPESIFLKYAQVIPKREAAAKNDTCKPVDA